MALKADRLKALDAWAWRPGVWAGKAGSLAGLARRPDSRTALLRPGGMGDLILLTVAIEESGLRHDEFLWIIERRSEDWAKVLRLPYLCIDQGLLAQHLRLAGRFRTVINTEQRFGLAQASARLLRRPRGTLASFSTNRGASSAQIRVDYDAGRAHESVEFSRLVAAATGGQALAEPPVRARMWPETEGLLVGIGGLQSASRTLSVDQWATLVEGWREGKPVEIASSPVDRQFASALARRLGAREFRGEFRQLCNRIASAEEIFTIDSGFHHIASYFGVPTTTIFTSGRERKWASLAEGSRIIRRTDLGCQPCTWFGQVPPCPYGFACTVLDFEKNLHPVQHSANVSSVAQETRIPSQSEKP